MASIDFGGVTEEVVTREEVSLENARATLKDEVVGIIGYGPQGHGQSLNLRDNGIKVLVGQRRGGRGWDEAVRDGWVEGETLLDDIEEVVRRSTIVEYLLSDAGQRDQWPVIRKNLQKGQALSFSHGFSVVF
ncbi:MAG: ketol-acid reductoisomerase, partial [Bacteroidota bacterium]